MKKIKKNMKEKGDKMNIFNEKLVSYLKMRRIKKGFSQRKLAKIIGSNHSTICDLESGVNKKVDIFLVLRICVALEIDFNSMLNILGFDKPEEKLYYILFKNSEENIFKVHAQTPEEARRIAYDFVYENNIIDFKKSDKNLLIGVADSMENFDKNVIDFFEKTGTIPKSEIDKIYQSLEEFEEENEGFLNENYDLDDENTCPYCNSRL